MSSIPEFAVCRDKPTITEIAGYYVLVYRRDVELTSLFADENRKICKLLAERVFPGNILGHVPEWKLPTDPESRLIEYYGKPVKYSKTRFGILKALICAKGTPIPYEEAAIAGWGEPTDRDVIESTIYQFNRFLAINGIPRFISCSKERIFFAKIGLPDESSEKN